RLFNLVDDGGPDQTFSRIAWLGGFALDAEDCANDRGVAVGHVAAKQDDRGCAVAGDIGAGGVDDVGEAYLVAEELVDELFAELTFHKRVRGDLPNKPCTCSIPAGAFSEVEKPFCKRHRQRISP